MWTNQEQCKNRVGVSEKRLSFLSGLGAGRFLLVRVSCSQPPACLVLFTDKQEDLLVGILILSPFLFPHILFEREGGGAVRELHFLRYIHNLFLVHAYETARTSYQMINHLLCLCSVYVSSLFFITFI